MRHSPRPHGNPRPITHRKAILACPNVMLVASHHPESGGPGRCFDKDATEMEGIGYAFGDALGRWS